MTALSNVLNSLPIPPQETYIDTSTVLRNSVINEPQKLCNQIGYHGPLILDNDGIVPEKPANASFFILGVGFDAAKLEAPLLLLLEETSYTSTGIQNLRVHHYEAKPLEKREIFTIHYKSLNQGCIFAPVSPKFYGEALSSVEVTTHLTTPEGNPRDYLLSLGERIYQIFMKIHKMDRKKTLLDMENSIQLIKTNRPLGTRLKQIALASAWRSIK